MKKLTPAQKELIQRLRDGEKYRQNFIICTSRRCWIGGGCGDTVSRNTIRALETAGILDGSPRKLTDKGKTIEL